MRQKISESLELLLSRFTVLTQQYELYLSQNQVPYIKAHERQLAYLITVANSLFSYGMPAAMTKQSRNRRAASQQYESNIGMGGHIQSPQYAQ